MNLKSKHSKEVVVSDNHCCLKISTSLYRNQESVVLLNLRDKALREQALVQWLLCISSLHLAADGCMS